MMTALVLSILLAAAPAAEPALQAPGAEAETATLSGIVTRAGTGEPLARAVIQLQPRSNQPAPVLAATGPAGILLVTTDGGGRFTLESVPPGDYVVTAYRNGFVRQVLGSTESDPRAIPVPVGLSAGEEREVVFQLIPAGTITGRVSDRFGEPVVGAQVEALRPVSLPDGAERLTPTQRATTDDRGQYRLFWLDPDTYYLRASSGDTGILRFLGGASTNAAPLAGPPSSAFFPAGVDETQAVPVTVNAGDELAGIDIRVAPVGGFSIRGRVITRDIPRNQVQQISLSLLPTVPANGYVSSNLSSRNVDAEGNFEIPNVPSGAYSLMASAVFSGRPGPRATMRVTVNNRDLENIVLTIGPGLSFRGRLFIEEPASPAATEAAQNFDWSAARPMLSTPGVPMSTAAVPTETPGEFLFESVQPGEYEFNIGMLASSGGFYVQRIRFNGEEIAVGAPIVVGDAVAEGLDVLLSPNGGTVSGIVSDEENQALGGAMVALIPEGETLESAPTLRRRTATADSNGAYSIAGVAPGGYRVQILPRTPTGILPAAGDGEPVTVSERESVTVNLRSESPENDR